MPRSDEAQAFFHAVYAAVQEIPHGKVTSYGHIAALIGTRKDISSSLSLSLYKIPRVAPQMYEGHSRSRS
jgi:hypothetical protein